jgi:hypothetical protein
MRKVVVAGNGQTTFGKFKERSVRSLAEEALQRVLKDAGIDASRIGVVYFANALSGLITGQETIRGQVALRYTPLMGTPIVNIDNACASGSSAFNLAWLSVASWFRSAEPGRRVASAGRDVPRRPAARQFRRGPPQSRSSRRRDRHCPDRGTDNPTSRRRRQASARRRKGCPGGVFGWRDRVRFRSCRRHHPVEVIARRRVFRGGA